MTVYADLPPMPDRQTGEPRPPKAPIRKPSNEQRKPWHPKKVPQPATNLGQVLEWEYADRRAQRWTFVVAFGLVMAFVVGKSLLDGGEFDWITTWWTWPIFAGLAALLPLGARNMRISAGADWLMDRSAAVKTYELSAVTMEKDWDEGEVHLVDKHGNKIEVGLGVLRINEALWDLVYNGIRHSVASGAQVNRMAVQRLRLHDVLGMYYEGRFGYWID